MNLDLLKKLVKLANNNPNENEANAAARKVCSLIEEAEFKFVEDRQSTNYNNIFSNVGGLGGPWINQQQSAEQQKAANEAIYEILREMEKQK